MTEKEKVWKDLVLAPTQLKVFSLLEQKGEMGLGQLAAELDITFSRTAQLVQRMVQLNLLSREKRGRNIYVRLKLSPEEFRQWAERTQAFTPLPQRVLEILKSGTYYRAQIEEKLDVTTPILLPALKVLLGCGAVEETIVTTGQVGRKFYRLHADAAQRYRVWLETQASTNPID